MLRSSLLRKPFIYFYTRYFLHIYLYHIESFAHSIHWTIFKNYFFIYLPLVLFFVGAIKHKIRLSQRPSTAASILAALDGSGPPSPSSAAATETKDKTGGMGLSTSEGDLGLSLSASGSNFVGFMKDARVLESRQRARRALQVPFVLCIWASFSFNYNR